MATLWLACAALAPRGSHRKDDSRKRGTDVKEEAQSFCPKGTNCQPDPNSCTGRGTNTLWGYRVQGAPDNSWNGEYSPGDPLQYIDNAPRFDKNGDKGLGRTLYRYNN